MGPRSQSTSMARNESNLVYCVRRATRGTLVDHHQFYYTQTFYLTVKIASCILWVLQSTLSTYWFWSHQHLGWVRGIELFFSLYFVVDALFVVLRRDFSQLTTRNIVTDYGIALVAYIWALELGIKASGTKSEGFASNAIDRKTEQGYSSIWSLGAPDSS
jgi:hypothetical protein